MSQVSHKTENIELQLLLEGIYQAYQYDFRGYSTASLKRRLVHALDHFRLSSLSALQERVLHDPTMLPRLLPYLTVQVSDFFRDPAYFRSLRQEVIPHLKTYPSLKIWVAGCASGEEAYSLAILLREEGLEQRSLIYGTDINPDALKTAKAGIYSLDRIAQFTRNYQQSGGTSSLSDYYTAAYTGAVFDQRLRERIVFSDHSLATDAAFAEMHLVSCRNVLIYFNRDLQNRAIGLFRDSLVRRGFLGLGSKESLRLTSHMDGFKEISPGDRIYQKIVE